MDDIAWAFGAAGVFLLAIWAVKQGLDKFYASQDRRRGKRLTLAEKQAQDAADEWNVTAIIDSVEAQLRAEREMSE